MNPFPGLRSFRSDEDYLFFGREEQTQELMARLERNRFIAVVGTSGRGKSSLVRCGLLSRLQGGGMVGAGAHWEIAVMHPGGDPLRHLAEALLEADLYDREAEDAVPHLLATLRRSQFGLIEAVRQAKLPAGTNFLLVVDQFEEIFRYDEAGRAESEVANDFIAMLREASAQTEVPIYIVTTMRSDFIGDCSRFDGLAEAVNRGEYLIPGLTRDQFKAAIEGPIRVAGGQLAPRLLQRLLNDLGEEQDQLPCLQHALMRTWRVWQSRADAPALDLEDYAQVGKMSQALSVHADEVFSGLASDHQRELCAAMFRALTVEGSEKRGIRRPRRLQTLCGILGVEAAELTPIIDAFRHPEVSFLMPPADVPLRDTTVIDLSHESLMRVWTRLRDWVDDEAKSVGIFRRLSESAALWRQGKSGFYRDPELSIARAWMDASRPNAVWAEQYDGNFDEAMAFLRASEDAAREEVRAREAARQRELEQARALAEAESRRAEEQTRFAGRLKWLVRGLGVVAAVALIAMGFAIASRRAAQHSATMARQAEAKTAAAGVMVDKARGNAERLLAFLLEDFYDELEPTGRLDSVVKLAREAVAYFDQLPPELRSPSTRRNRAMALMRIGQAQIRMRGEGMGKNEINQAIAEMEQLFQGGDRSEATIVALCAALRADFTPMSSPSTINTDPQKDQAYRADRARCVELLRPLADSGRGSLAVRLELAAQLRDWGFYLRSGGDDPDVRLRESLAHLAEARDMLAGAGALTGSNLRIAANYANVTMQMGEASARQTYDDARRLFEEAITVAEKVLSLQPGNNTALFARAQANARYSYLCRLRGQHAEALRRAIAGNEAFGLAIQADPSNTRLRGFTRSVRRTLAGLLIEEGRIHEGLKVLRTVLELTERGGLQDWVDLASVEAARGNRTAVESALAEWERAGGVREELQFHLGQAQLHRLLGDYPQCVIEAKQAASMAEAALAAPNLAPRNRRTAESRLAFAAFTWGRAAMALAHWTEAEEQLLRVLRITKGDLQVLYSTSGVPDTEIASWLAVALARQGRRTEAVAALGKSNLEKLQAYYTKGNRTLLVRWNLALGHYASALTQADDAAGREKRAAALRQAKALLDESTEEARQLSEERELRRLIDEELARL